MLSAETMASRMKRWLYARGAMVGMNLKVLELG